MAKKRKQTVKKSEAAPVKKERKIAIIGKAPSSIPFAPWKDESWEIWVLNNLAHRNMVSRWDVQFELHNLALTREPVYGDYYDWLCRQEKPVVLREPCEEIKSGKVYPFEEVNKRFNINLVTNIGGESTSRKQPAEYWNNTVSYMIALAICEGATSIGVYGVDMAQFGAGVKSEYSAQRPSCEMFLGFAMGLGIEVYLPSVSDLLKASRRYALDDPLIYEQKLSSREVELQTRIDAAAAQENKGREERIYLSGALENTSWVRQNFPEGDGGSRKA